MKTSTMRVMMMAATAVTATAAYGQSMKVTVPFEFRAGGKTLPAGSYDVQAVQTIGSLPIYRIAGEGVATAANPSSRLTQRAATANPRLRFDCGDAGCVLTEIWGPESGVRMSNPGAHATERVVLAAKK